jgi:two-component system nitrate/nitrite response regulator NarL
LLRLALLARGRGRLRMTRIILIADTGFYRDGLAYVLPRRYGLEVVGVAASAAEALEVPLECPPDLILVDMKMRQSFDVLRTLASRAPAVKVLALSVKERETDVLACIEAGAAGYVTHKASLDDVADSIERTTRDEPLASPQIVATLMRRVAALASHADGHHGSALTSREFEIVGLIDEGLSNKEIAIRLSIEVATVKNHVHNILEKLQVSRRGEAAARVRAYGLTSPSRRSKLAIAG